MTDVTPQADAALSAPADREPLTLINVRQGMFAARGDTSGYDGLVRHIQMPGATERPYGGWFDEVVDVLEELLGEDAAAALEQVTVYNEELTLYVARDFLPQVARHLRDDQDLRFEMCLGVNGVHYPADTGRELHAVYPMQSITHNRRLRVEVAVSEADPHIPSIVDTYPMNNWHERETWDFFGIIFDGHPSLARIAMPDDWVGHPQRKDYPLGGIPIEYKGAEVAAPEHRRQYR